MSGILTPDITDKRGISKTFCNYFMNQKLVPTISVDKFTNFAKSKEVIIAVVSFVITPLAIGYIQEGLLKVSFFQNNNNLTIGLVFVGFLLFLFASQMKGLVRTVGIAVGAGVFVSAILSFGAVQDALNKVGVQK